MSRTILLRALLFIIGSFCWTVPAAAQELPGIPWSTGGFVDTGAGYDMSSGMPKRYVVDFEVPGSVGQYPLKAARTLVTRRPSTIEDPMIANWIFDLDFRAVQFNSVFEVRYPSGTFVDFGYPPAGIADRLLWSGGVPTLYLADGGRVEFTLVTTNSSSFARYFAGTRIIDRHGLVTTVTRQGELGPKRITDPTGRYIDFTWSGNKVTKVVASTGEQVSYTWQEQIGYDLPLITKANYDDGTSAFYRYSGLNESCGANLPLELSDTRSSSKIPHVKYEWQFFNISRACELYSEREGVSNVVVSTRASFLREVLPSGEERNFIFDFTPFLYEKRDFLGNVEKYGYDSNSFLNLVEDRLGRKTKFTHESVAGQLTQIEYPDGAKVKYTYTSTSKPYYVASVTDARDKVTSYSYFSSGVLKSVNYPDGTTESWDEVNTLGQAEKHVLRNGALERFDYDSKGRLLSHWLPAFGEPTERIRYTYYPDGHAWEDLLESETDALGNKTTLKYRTLTVSNPFHGPQLELQVHGRHSPQTIIYSDGTSRTVVLDEYGNKRSETNELGKSKKFTYDAYNRLLNETDEIGRVTTYDYTPKNPQLSPLSHTSKNPRKVTSNGGEVTVYDYDAEGRLLSIIEDKGGVDATRSFTYDKVGNITSQTDPEWRETSYTYDARDRKVTQTDPGDLKSTWEYDKNGNVTRLTHPDDKVSTWTYDAMNRVLKKTDESGRLTSYEYTDSGKVRWITDFRGALSGYVYDAQDRVTDRRSPGSTLGSYRTQEKLTYDAHGNLINKLDRRGVEIAYTYNNRNREISRTPSDGTMRVRTTYDAVGRIASKDTGYGAPPELAPIQSVGYTYNDAGEVIQESQRVNMSTIAITYTYDDDGNIDKVEWPDGNLDHTWDGANRLTKITTSSLGNVVSYKYFDDGQRQEKTLGNGLKTLFEYDDAGRLAYISGPGQPTRDIYYDERSRPVRIASAGGRFNETFEYSPDSQLELYKRREALAEGPPPVPTRTITQSFTYDDSGNRKAQTFEGNVTNYNVSGTNALLTTSGHVNWTFSQDSVGNTTSRGTLQIEYDAYWRVTKITSPATNYLGTNETVATYQYDAVGRLVRTTKKGPSTGGATVVRRAVYVGDHPVTWYDSDGVAVEKTIWGNRGDEPLYTWRKNFGTVYYHLDHQNNVTSVTNSSGVTMEVYFFDPFGTPHYYEPGAVWTERAASTMNPPYLFTGQMWLADWGLHHYKARVYDPTFGRFLQPDPSFIDAGDLNLFRYVGNNPYTYVDPTGRAIDTIWDLWNVASGAESFAKNIASGEYWSAALDALGVVVDAVAVIVPGAPGGAGAGIKVIRGAEKVVDTVKGADKVSEVSKAADAVADGASAAKGARQKNRLPDVGEPNTVAHNPSGTTSKKYGPDGHVQKEWNKGHTDQKTPKNEQTDHIHDYKPNPYHPEGKPTRQEGREPRNEDLYELDRLSRLL